MSVLLPLAKLLIATYMRAGGRLQFDIESIKPLAVSTYRGGAYCGPGWGFTIDEIKEKGIASSPGTIDAIEAACKMHDECYKAKGYCNRACNEQLVERLMNAVRDPDSPRSLQFDALVMAAIFQIEAMTVDRWLERYGELYQSISRMFGSGQMTMEFIILWHIAHFR